MVIIGAGMLPVLPAQGAEDPDELYKEGRYAEAEAIYARSDMDHPKDLRHRYNRGCADYQAEDYKGAMAAFSSVLRRAEDRETRFRAAYNLGNAAFQQGDAASAADYYRQALRIDPEQVDARHNLEIALRQVEAQKKEKKDKEKSARQEEGEKDPSKKDNEKGKPQEKPSSNESPNKDGDQERDPDKKNGGTPPEEKKDEHEQKETGQGQDQKPDDQSPKDLAGELKPREALPKQSEEPEGGPPAVSSMDQKRAEALLDNVTEDRSKFLQVQFPEGKRRGAISGKDW